MKKQLLITLLAITLCGSIQAANMFRKIVAGATGGAISALTLSIYYNSQKKTFPTATKTPADTLRACKLNKTTPEETTQKLREAVLKTDAQIHQDYQNEITTTQTLRSKVLRKNPNPQLPIESTIKEFEIDPNATIEEKKILPYINFSTYYK